MAATANSLQFDVVGGELVVVSARELVHKLFEAWRAFEVYEFPAFDTHEMVMMRLERFCELIALLEADLDDIDDTEFSKELQRPVDTGALGELACL